MVMRKNRDWPRLEGRRVDVQLPADGVTLARSLSGGLMLVAHTGNAHLGLPVGRRLLRDVVRARAHLPTVVDASDHERAPLADDPEVIPFRHATAHTLTVSSDDVHLTLHATGDPGKPDVHVQLRMRHLLVVRLAERHHQDRRCDRMLALATLLILACSIVATLAMVS
jgi:hypothetical protein